jgi:hypothetical protein
LNNLVTGLLSSPFESIFKIFITFCKLHSFFRESFNNFFALCFSFDSFFLSFLSSFDCFFEVGASSIPSSLIPAIPLLFSFELNTFFFILYTKKFFDFIFK